MPSEPGQTPLLEIKDLHVAFRSVAGITKAVNGVHLEVRREEILGLVGESGCGKSVTARSVLGLVPTPPAVFEKGEVWLQTHRDRLEVLSLLRKPKELRAIRGREVSMIFQEPMRSLHPTMSVGDQIVEGILLHEHSDLQTAYGEAADMLEAVGLPQPRHLLRRYPHELSGGMRQRVMIALALATRPQLLIADEPTTALDVTIQAQILDLVRSLRRRLGMSVLWISHNIGVIANIADRVSVMYLGVVVETAPVQELLDEPAHPYTQGLLASIPSLLTEPKTRLRALEGTVPELAATPQGCVFADRCTYVMEKCGYTPPVVDLGADRSVKCWLYKQ